ncbi:DUF4347 domain-containing protein [Kaistella palustris]|uniref:DUF4347 domain-containing protein n=1 Tax=Kaistella palustris TaxID=493376 RepID=UPI00041586E5|nr:DUF4347 domain-containing protein [Kaistella palustris]
MKKNLVFLLAIFCHAFLFGKSPGHTSVYVDASLTNLSVSDKIINPQTFHLFSHGRPGELYVNNEWMDAPKIAAHFRENLKGKTELYIYGCSFAQGAKGEAAVQYLRKNLGVEVSASTNVTGKDGDWILESGHGQNSLVVKNYAGNLQLDKKHYLNPIVVGAYTNVTVTEEYIYLSTPSVSNITVQMDFPAGSGSPRVSVKNLNGGAATIVTNGSLTFNNANPLRLQFVDSSGQVIAPGNTPTTIPLEKAGTIISGTAEGLVFTSNDTFYVNYRARSTPQAGSVLAKGTTALGKEFRWGGSPVEYSTTIRETGNMLSVMASEDNTTVIISNIKSGTKFINGSGGTTLTGPSITKILQKGQSFILYAPVVYNQTSIQDTGWLGAKVLSNKDITTVVGGLLQQGSSSDNRDIGLDQLVPINKLGLEHVIMKGNGKTREKVIVIATESNTDVYLNSSGSPFVTLAAAGDYVLIPSSNFNSGGNMRILVSNPAYVFHKIFGSDRDNTNSLMFIPPLSCFGQKVVDIIPDARRIGNTAYTDTELAVLAVPGTANKPVVTLNGAPVATTSPATGNAVAGNSNWVSYRFPITNNGDVKVTSAGTIQAEIFGADNDAGYGGYYSGFGETPIYTISLNTSYPYPCLGKTTMSIPANLGTYQWYRNNVAISGATSNSYTLNLTTDPASASYYVIVTFPGDCTVRSNTLVSDDCPCSKPGATGTPDSYTDFGISIRDKRTTANWPKDVPNGFMTIESNTKGFVVTRMLSPETSILNPVPGMLVYDTDDDCLKMYDGSGWKCIKQVCND